MGVIHCIKKMVAPINGGFDKMYQQLVHTEEHEGFEIKLYLVPEDSTPDWDFETEEERRELLEDIDNGNLLWFIAKVTASKADIELSVDYLGGCCYRSVDEFIEEGYYYKDMRGTVIHAAKLKIKELCYTSGSF